jgi:hypothetical protein
MCIEVDVVSTLLGLSRRSVSRFVKMFMATGAVVVQKRRRVYERWPREVYNWMGDYVISFPCFYIEELQQALCSKFPELVNVSQATICRALMHDLSLTRKG